MSFNATVAAPFYQTIYADTDFSSLSWLEQRWVAYYVWIGNPIIATGLMAFLMHEVCTLFNDWSIVLIILQIVYFGRSIPWIIIDAIPYFKKWKLQPNKVHSPEEQWQCIKQVLFSHFTVELPAVRIPYFFYFFFLLTM
jgi:methylsterol monooxygenase